MLTHPQQQEQLVAHSTFGFFTTMTLSAMQPTAA
jgi:hypothetical protein